MSGTLMELTLSRIASPIRRIVTSAGMAGGSLADRDAAHHRPSLDEHRGAGQHAIGSRGQPEAAATAGS